MSAIVSILADVLMIVGPCAGYIDQIRQFVNTKSSGGFSKFISLILLIANILRCFFRYYKEFENVLLYQSILMIACQVVLIFFCIRFRSTENGTIFTSPVRSFWNWINISSYLTFLIIFSLVVGLVSLILHPIFGDFYGELLGGAALFTEAVLAVPQVYRNYREGSAEGLSWVLLGTFFLGDAYKTGYFYHKGLPIQFVLCGSFQLFVDFVLAFQVLTYRKKRGGGLLSY